MFEQFKIEKWEDIYALYQNNEEFRNYAKQQKVIIQANGFKVYRYQYAINDFAAEFRYQGIFLGYPIFELSIVNFNYVNPTDVEEKLFENISYLLKLFVQLLGKTEYLVVPEIVFEDSSPKRELVDMYKSFNDRLFTKEDKLKIKFFHRRNHFLCEFFLTLNLFLNKSVNMRRYNRINNAGQFFGEFDEKLVEKFMVMKDNFQNSLMKINQKIPFVTRENYIKFSSRNLKDFLDNYYSNTRSVSLFNKLYKCKINFSFLTSSNFSENDFSIQLEDIVGKDSFNLTMETLKVLEQEWLSEKEEKEIEELMSSYIPQGFEYIMEKAMKGFEIDDKRLERLFKQFFLANQPSTMAEFEKKLIILKNTLETKYFDYQMKNPTRDIVVKGMYFKLNGTKQILAIIMEKIKMKDIKDIKKYDYYFYQGDFEDLESAPITTLFKEMI